MRRFIDAVRTLCEMNNTDQDLLDLVVKLDGLLTERPEEAMKNARQHSYLFVDAVTFLLGVMANTYYLADGGYSRLLFDDEIGVKGVDSISRDEVKRRWNTPEVQQLVEMLNRYLMAAISGS